MTRVQWVWLALCWAGVVASVAQSACGPGAEARRLREENRILLERAASAERTAERLAVALNELFYDRSGRLPAADGPLRADRFLEARR